MSYSDIKALCKDLIQDELSIYRAEALRIASDREEKLRNSILEKLESEKVENVNVLEAFKDPDLQFSYVNAQKAYIRVGTDELENVLTELLFNRIKESRRSLLQLTLNESLNIVPMLIPEQLNILSLCFILKYTVTEAVMNFNIFKEYLLKIVFPHFSGDLKRQSLYQHIEYSRCGQISIASNTIENILIHTYKGLFFKGLPLAEVEELKTRYMGCFTPCINNSDLWQLSALNDNYMDKLLTQIDSVDDRKKMKSLYNRGLMSEKEVRDKIIEILPTAEEIFDIWNNSYLKNLTLTSVGIVIGATYSKQISGNVYDLSIWI